MVSMVGGAVACLASNVQHSPHLLNIDSVSSPASRPTDFPARFPSVIVITGDSVQR